MKKISSKRNKPADSGQPDDPFCPSPTEEGDNVFDLTANTFELTAKAFRCILAQLDTLRNYVAELEKGITAAIEDSKEHS